MIVLRIAELAQDRGYSITRLQHETGLSASTVRRYWHNRVQRVGLLILEAFARVLEVSVNELFAREPAPAASATPSSRPV